MNALIENIQPFYFGPLEKQLYGIYEAGSGRNSAVLLCYPLGDEYMRGHRAYRQLALRLNRMSFPVMRFDYFGTGDSAGEDVEASLTKWVANISLAIDELKLRSGVSKVCLAGLRLGAALALQAALKRSDVGGVVMWEPVISGSAYLEELQEAHSRKLLYMGGNHDTPPEGRPTEILGFGISQSFYDESRALDLLALQARSGLPIFVTEAEEHPAVTQFRQHLESQGGSARYQVAEGPTIWAEDPDKALVPHQVLQAIVTWVSEAFT